MWPVFYIRDSILVYISFIIHLVKYPYNWDQSKAENEYMIPLYSLSNYIAYFLSPIESRVLAYLQNQSIRIFSIENIFYIKYLGVFELGG